MPQTQLPPALLVARDYFPPQVGGISTMMQRILTEFGPQRVIVLTADEGPVSMETPHGLAHIHRFSWPFRWPTPLDYLLMTGVIGAMRLRYGIRTLLLAGVGEAHIGQLTRRTLRLPYVVFAHGNEVLTLQNSTWERSRRALIEAAAVIANSRYTAEIVQRLGVDDARIHVVHPGCDVDHFRPPSSAERMAERERLQCADRFMLLTVGNLVERKGQDLVLRALAQLRSQIPNVCYCIAGTGRYEAALRALAAELHIEDCVRFLGHVPTERLPALYGACDLFVMPSRLRAADADVEGFGIVYVEAGACGCAVIGGRSGGVNDAIVEGRTGMLVDPTVIDELAQTILRLHADRDLRHRLGAEARARACRELTWKHFAARVAQIVNAVVEPTSGRS